MFGSTVGFSGSADQMALFLVSINPRWRLGRHVEKFKWGYLCGRSSDLLRVWFYDGIIVVSGSNGAVSGLTKNSIGMWEKTMREE